MGFSSTRYIDGNIRDIFVDHLLVVDCNWCQVVPRHKFQFGTRSYVECRTGEDRTG